MKSPNLDIRSLTAKLKQLQPKIYRHLAFIVTIFALMVYLFVIWHIKALVSTEPDTEAEQSAISGTRLPKIDQKAISQIQSLENNSPAIHSLFNKARNNPFHE